MSLVLEYQQKAKEIRDRLIRPPNAVKDIGIDLKRLKPGTVLMEKRRLGQAPKEKAKEQRIINVGGASLVMEVVAGYFGLGVLDLLGPSRKMKYVNARHIAIYLASKHTKLSSIAIGRVFHRDHSSCIHGRKKIELLLSTDPAMPSLIMALEERIAANG